MHDPEAGRSSVKVLVLGESGERVLSFVYSRFFFPAPLKSGAGVGKTCLCQAICGLPVNELYNPTVGCEIQVLDLGTDGGFPTEQFVELWDIGGNPRYKDVRKMFYDHVDGVMFMWDLSAKKSLQQLDEWMEELTTMDQGPFDLEDESPGSNSHLPLLVVGNKTDRAPAERAHVSYAHTEAHTSATDAHFERARFMEFFTQVVQRKRQRMFRASHSRTHVLTSPAVIEFHRDAPTRGVRHRNDPSY